MNDGYISPEVFNKKTPLKTRLGLDSNFKSVAFEYQGAHVHGHPYMWMDYDDPSLHPLFDAWTRDLEKWQACERNGTKLFYILDIDFKEWKKHSVGMSLLSFCREAQVHF